MWLIRTFPSQAVSNDTQEVIEKQLILWYYPFVHCAGHVRLNWALEAPAINAFRINTYEKQGEGGCYC